MAAVVVVVAATAASAALGDTVKQYLCYTTVTSIFVGSFLFWFLLLFLLLLSGCILNLLLSKDTRRHTFIERKRGGGE